MFLAVQVHKMSTAHFRGSGLFQIFWNFRKCYFEGIPDVHLEDVWFKPVLNQDNESEAYLKTYISHRNIGLCGETFRL